MPLELLQSGFTATIRWECAMAGAPPFRMSASTLDFAHPGLEVRVVARGDSRLQRAPERPLAVLLHGDLRGTARTPADLVGSYAREGIGFVRGLEGSFALMVVDGERGEVWLATDRANSRRLCVREQAGVVEVATDLSRFAADDAAVDPVGLAWYFSNGAVHGERTVLTGVRRMGRAVWQRIGTDGPGPAETYWSPPFTSEYAGRDRADVKREFAEALVEAVRRTVPESEPLQLSLSAGHDAAGIAGILARRPDHGGIRAFSYGLDPDREGCDAWAARRMAERLGFPHRFVRSHDGDIVAAIERNASWGDGQALFCDESFAWLCLRHELGDQRPWLCVGEQFFGGLDMRTPCDDEMLRVCGMRRLHSQPWLRPFLSAGTFEPMVDGQEADVAAILDRARQVGSMQDARAFLYLDPKLPNVLLVWRERFAGRAFRVLNPWLSNDLLDFTGKLPHAWRVAKNLYKETVAELLPEVFADPRAAASGYIPDWQTELSRQKGRVAEAFASRESRSPLDAFVDPGTMRSLLARCAPAFDPRRSQWSQITRDRLRFTVGRRLGLSSEYRGPTEPERTTFLLRYLTLRRFLELARQEPRVSDLAVPRGAGQPG